MDFDGMSREELVQHIQEMNDYMDNVIVFWGGKREFRETFEQVARNHEGEYTQEEARNASVILESDGAFDKFVELVRDSFERGGISYVLSEKISAIMEEVATRSARLDTRWSVAAGPIFIIFISRSEEFRVDKSPGIHIMNTIL
jgi:hypothetical protein